MNKHVKMYSVVNKKTVYGKTLSVIVCHMCMHRLTL